METFDLIVVGAGIVGLSTAWRARKAGAKVLVLDKGATAYEASSRATAGSSALVVAAHLFVGRACFLHATGGKAKLPRQLAPQRPHHRAVGLDRGIARRDFVAHQHDATHGRGSRR